MNKQCERLRRQAITNSLNYIFPILLKFLRQTEGKSRKQICEDTGLTENRLFYLENGSFKWPPKEHEYDLLSDRYGIGKDKLKNSCANYLEQKQNR